MDDKYPRYNLKVPSARGGLPGCADDILRLDDHLMEPNWLARVLADHVAPGYEASTDLLSLPDVASNACIRNPVFLELAATLEAIAEGEAKGRAKGKAEAILEVLEERGIAVSPAQREEILACTDLARLRRWVRRAGLVSSGEELVAGD